MYQIVELLEHGCADFLAIPASSGTVAKFDNVGGGLTGFGFGGMQMDPREQRAWRAKVVMREIQNVKETHQRIVRLAQIGLVDDKTLNWSSEQPPDQHCHEDLERRLQAHCSEFQKVKNRWQERNYV
jgi:hypothetical protein